jgi:hypothetical protein
MNPDTVEPILKELLHQQADIAAANEKADEAREQMFLKLEAFDKKLDTVKASVTAETSVVVSSVKKGTEELKGIVEAQPKVVVHEKSFTLFPNHSEEYYKVIFGNFFRGIVILIIGIYALVILNRYVYEREYLHYKKAWQYLYSQGREDYKMVLDTVWKESEKVK